MAKIIKRAGMIFFVSVISCLIALGCVLTMQVEESSNNGIVNADTQNNIYTSQNNEDYKTNFDSTAGTTYDIPDAKNEFVLDCDCPDGEPCMCGKMAKIWQNAMDYSSNHNTVVKVVLEKDWIAMDVDNKNRTAFGASGSGFDGGRIQINADCKVIFDLNGKTVNRRLTEETANTTGTCFVLRGELYLIDSCYDSNQVNAVYEQNFNSNDCSTLITEWNKMNIGKITGGSRGGETGGWFGGGIVGDSKSKLFMYGGMIIDNYALEGGGVHTNGDFYMYDGIIANNKSGNVGGGIAAYRYSTVSNIVICGGYVVANTAVEGGGGVYVHAKGEFNGGVIGNNTLINKNATGGGVYVGAYANLVINDIDIRSNHIGTESGNENQNGGGISCEGKMQLNGGRIRDNSATHGGGIILTGKANVTINDCIISGNYVSVKETGRGGAIYINSSNVRLFLLGGSITKTAYSTDNAAYLGVYCDESVTPDLYIGGSVVCLVKNSSSKKVVSGFFLYNNQYVKILEDLQQTYSGAQICFYVPDTSRTTPLATNYIWNNAKPSNFVFAANGSNLYDLSVNGKKELVLSTAITAVDTKWEIVKIEDENTEVVFSGTTMDKVHLEYSPIGYHVRCYNASTNAILSFYCYGISGMRDEFILSEVGNYTAYYDGGAGKLRSCLNFTILPAEVDIKWESTELVYNGGSQKPTAYIAEDPNCKVTVIGEQINSGSGYVATATGLSNKNYKINTSTMNKMFSISKAKLEKPKGSGTFEYDGSEKEYIPNGYNNVTMNITGNKATAVGNYNATVSLKDKYNYVWNDGGVEDIVLPYSVTLTPPVDEDDSEYKFIYIDNEDGKQVRKTYKQGGLVHGINDGEVNGGKLVLGNVKPNTSVKSFIQTLGFEQSKITIKDSKGKDIFKDGTPVDASKFDNGKELAVGTGWSVEYQNNGNTETIYISVLGDVNGDGRISASDVTYLRQIASDNALYESLSVEKKLASMVINKGNVTSADAEIVRNVVDKLLTMDLFF